MTDVFVASNIETAYPRKLQKPSTVNETVRSTAETFILDSGIGDDTSNREVLDLAYYYDADYVIAKDYLHDQQATTDSIAVFFEEYEQHPCQATPMVPLQPPHDRHYRELTAELGRFDHYVLGGMAVPSVGTTEQVRHIRAFDRAVHDDAHVHALGVGGGLEFATTVAPLEILDSIDCATPELAATNGCVIDADLKQTEVREMKGDGAKKRNRPLAEFNSHQVQDVWDRLKRESNATTQDTLF